MGLRYGGKIVDDYSAMQGPCPDGFHVPSKDEWVALCGILTTTFGMEKKPITMGTYLKMPKAGYRSYSSSGTGQQGGHGRYWSSTPSPTVSNAYYLFFSSVTINPQNYDRYSYGFSVRGFKDSPVIPDGSWTTLYDGSSVATGAGVFRNSSLGLISVSGDGTTWYTIMDKNLGATTVFNQEDTLTDDNCGKYYQWGNNYGFAWTGTVTTSSTQVDARDYGPGNYYSSDTFITGSAGRDSSRNGNLRGGETGVQQGPAPIKKRYYGGKMVSDYSAMQGPCDTGFHVPLSNEFVSLVSHLSTLGIDTSNGIGVKTYLKMPFAGYRDSNAAIGSQGTQGFYWYSDTRSYVGKGLMMQDDLLNAAFNYYRVYTFSIRPFKAGS